MTDGSMARPLNAALAVISNLASWVVVADRYSMPRHIYGFGHSKL